MNRTALFPALLCALILIAAGPGGASACTNPLELVMERGAYDKEFKSSVLDLSATLDDVDAKLNAGAVGDATAGLDTLVEKWFALYTRYAPAPPEGWKGRDGWLESLSNVTKAMKELRDTVARGGAAAESHERMQNLNVALSLLFKEDLPFDPTQLVNTDNWPLSREAETVEGALDPRAVEDAALHLGRKTRELLDSLDGRTAAVELLTAGAGTFETAFAERFVRSFRRHADFSSGETKAISLSVDPREPLSLLTAAEAGRRAGASLRVLCRYTGASFREREYRPDLAGVRMRRLERVWSARFRVIADALDGERPPLLLEEVAGKFIQDTVYQTGTDGVELVKSEYRAYEHFPGIDAYGAEPAEGGGSSR